MPEKELSELEEYLFAIYLRLKSVREGETAKRESAEKRRPKLKLLKGGKKEVK